MHWLMWRNMKLVLQTLTFWDFTGKHYKLLSNFKWRWWYNPRAQNIHLFEFSPFLYGISVWSVIIDSKILSKILPKDQWFYFSKKLGGSIFLGGKYAKIRKLLFQLKVGCIHNIVFYRPFVKSNTMNIIK